MIERLELTQKRFDPEAVYAIDGRALNRLYRISILFNDGHVMSPDERRDLAQEMQLLLTGETYIIEKS